MINLGIIGCGRVTETVHLPVLRHMPGVRVLAACDMRNDRLKLVQQAFGIPHVYSDWTDLIADRSVNAVLVATPSDSHALIGGAALDGQKHVLVEKPFALTVTDAEMLAEKARTSERVSMVGFNYRFHPLARELKATIQRGAIGRPLAVFTTFMTARNQSASVTDYKTVVARGGGVFHDKATHNFDVLRFLFDSEVRHGRAISHSEVHEQDVGTIEMELANGVQVSGCFCDRAVPDHTYVVYGDQGKAMMNLTRPTGVLLYRTEFSRGRATKLWSYLRQAPRVITSTVRLATPRGRLSSYFNQWQHFFSAIDTRSPATPNFEDGLAVTRAVNQLIDSLTDSRQAGADGAGLDSFDVRSSTFEVEEIG
jgi:UDP-N-acetylglucosamine 3-dehydrogenase